MRFVGRNIDCVFLGAVAAVSIGLTIVGLLHADPRSLSSWRALLLALAPLGLAALCVFLLLRPRATRMAASLTLAAALFGAYAAEAWILIGQAQAVQRAELARAGRQSPTMLAKIRELRSAGIEAYPAIYPAYVALNLAGEYADLLRLNGAPLIALGGVPDALTVFCEGAGGWVIYHSDEHGFVNPRGIWGAPVEIAAVGDSFAQGACVPPEQNALGYIRRQIPATLNLAQGGNGPLFELAGIREYLPLVRPRVVLWFFFDGNDVENLLTEKSIPEISRYLDPRHRRDLPSHKAESARILKQLVEREMSRTARPNETIDQQPGQRQWKLFAIPGLSHATERFLLLANVRDAFGLNFSMAAWRDTMALLGRVLEQGRRDVEAWDGRLYFVYLPSYETAAYRQRRRVAAHDDVVATARAAGLPVIDLLPVFSESRDLGQLFDPISGHYSPAGYALTGEKVLEAIR